MKKNVQRAKNGKVITPEDEFRRKLRFTARVLDHDLELRNIGYGQEMLDMIRKNPMTAMTYDNNLSRMLNSFTKKPLGYEHELLCLFDKYDTMLKTCKSDKERRAIGAMGVIEVSKLLDDGEVGIGGSLTVNGQVIADKINKKETN